MPTVCHVITKLELGGAQEVALYAASHLDRRRFHAVLMTGPGGLLTDEARAVPHLDLRIIPHLRREIRPLHDLCALIELVRSFRALRPAIVHTHSSKAGILGRWAAWLAGVPVVIHTIHGYGITPSQAPLVRWLLVLVERLTGWLTTQWVSVSQADAIQGRRWKLFTPDRVSVIRPGIDLTLFTKPLTAIARRDLRRALGVGPNDLLVGTVACLKPQKAPLDFLAVARRVCERYTSAKWVLVGDGELRPQVEEAIRDAGLTDRVRLLGWRRDIPELMQAFDVFLLTSHWEGLPRVLLEARAARLPVVATRVGGASEAIKDGRHGWLVEMGDVVGMTERVCEVLSDSSFRARVRASAADLPEEFDIRVMVRQYEQLYARLTSPSTTSADQATLRTGDVSPSREGVQR
jgi:glycosyltransferase involved in cell wall biosynthesis